VSKNITHDGCDRVGEVDGEVVSRNSDRAGKPSKVAQKIAKKSSVLVVYADPHGQMVLGREIHPGDLWSFLDSG
jgi:hypothetical protein